VDCAEPERNGDVLFGTTDFLLGEAFCLWDNCSYVVERQQNHEGSYSMDLCRKALLVSLSSVILISGHMPVFAESMLVPRLGYPTVGIKRVYLDVTPSEKREADDKLKKELEKANKKETKAQQKALKKESKEKAKADQDDTAVEQDDVTTDTVSQDSASSESDAEFIKEQAKEQAKKDKNLSHDEAKKKAEADKLHRMQDRREAKQLEFNKVPVEGIFYLYNVKQGRMLFKEPTKVSAVPTEVGTTAAPYYVEFKEGAAEGLYELTVRGSGHRSEKPLWVSDYVYWDAMQPVLQDVGKTHCPDQQGIFRILQQCYMLNAQPKGATNTEIDPKFQLVKGGWFVDNTPQTGMVKSTRDIATLSQMMMHLYNLNPKSYKYVVLWGNHYAQSRFPDILDEANWGLDYLVSIQQPDGSFPAGIEKNLAENKESYWLMNATPESTALSVHTLASAVTTFKPEDLSLAVKFMRAAEKGWTALKAQSKNVDPTLMLMASSAMMQASDDPRYAEAFQVAKAQVQSIYPQTALLMGPAAEGITVNEQSVDLASTDIMAIQPLLVQLQQDNPTAFDGLNQWVTDLFGYDTVSLVRDPNLTVVSAWIDPLQWMATKTGEVATRLTQIRPDTSSVAAEKNTDPKVLKELEDKELEARKRVKVGYDKLKLSTMDRVYLAYALAVLNQKLSPMVDPDAKKEPARDPHYDPPGVKKGFWPKLI
jgi:hypothetical protein